MFFSEDEIIRRLAHAQEPLCSEGEGEYPSALLSDAPRPAAVLIPFLRMEGAWHILYTRRNASLAEHSGQVAFPGGRSDPGDASPEMTALRETYEEVGILPQDVRILGRLGNLMTITNYCVTPVVGVIPWPYSLVLCEHEVSRVFTIPLAWLADPAHRETRTRTLPGSYVQVPVIYFEHYDSELLWGISAQITVNLLRLLEN